MAEILPEITTWGVISLAHVVPIYKPDDRWQLWALHEIWVGPDSTDPLKKYVPKVRDYVVDADNYEMYVCDHIDPVTLVSTLRNIRPANMSFGFTETDVLFGGTQSDTYRVYIDKSVMPYILAVDARLKVGGTMCSYAKLFRGYNIVGGGEVISKIYDTSGNFVSENVPLELVAIDSHVNHSIKNIPVCYTTTDLDDGEVAVAVLYNDKGHVVSKRQLLVEETSFIRSINASSKYVTSLSLETVFISPTLDHVIEFPINVPLNTLNLIGVVHYSNGDTLKLPVDGTRFKMFGLDQYVSSIIGQTIELVLSYALGETETAYAGVATPPIKGVIPAKHYVTEAYKLITVNPNNSYTVKLFGYPKWVNDTAGYTMVFWLYNLDRNLFFNVTSFVRFSDTTGPYNPTAYGVLQRKAISINLRDVSGAYKPLIHTQVMDIVLNGKPNENTQPWTVSHEAIAGRPEYGLKLIARRKDTKVLNVASGIETFEEWRKQVYEHTYPLVDQGKETTAPRPTHFVIEYASTKIEIPMINWDQDIITDIEVPLYDTIWIRFIKRLSLSDLQLSMAAMIVRPV